MKRTVKVFMIVLMIVGLIFSALNIISVANIAGEASDFRRDVRISSAFTGTQQPDGCYGEPLNCPTNKK